MRNATILVDRLRGTATETIKNIVLAGIGKLILVDEDNVAEEDLGAGFFFRDDDVGKKASLLHYPMNRKFTGKYSDRFRESKQPRHESKASTHL